MSNVDYIKMVEELHNDWEKNMEIRRKRNRRIEKFVYLPIRILIFPIMLPVRLFMWTYGYEHK